MSAASAAAGGERKGKNQKDVSKIESLPLRRGTGLLCFFFFLYYDCLKEST